MIFKEINTFILSVVLFTVYQSITDDEIFYWEFLAYYHCRFQMESNFRDAKQSVGLNHSQVRDLDKFYFHFNVSLTTVNIAKIIHLKDINKLLYHNASLLNQFIETFGIKPKTLKSHHPVKELLYSGTKAA